MITGAHSIIYSQNPEADRAFLRDVAGLTHVDVGGGWLIFGLPPSEVVVHPSETNEVHEFYLMCKDVRAFVDALAKRDLRCDDVQDMGWGLLTRVSLPGGGKLGVYEPRHLRPRAMPLAPRPARPKAKAAKVKVKPAQARAKAKAKKKSPAQKPARPKAKAGRSKPTARKSRR